MTDKTHEICEQFIYSKDILKKVFSWEYGFIHAVGACILTLEGKKADEARLRHTKELLKKKFNAFSNFRGNASVFTIVMVSMTHDPELTLSRTAEIYKMLKEKKMPVSVYLTVAAAMIAIYCEPYEYAAAVSRTRELYTLMKEKHPILTSYEEAPYCTLLAMSDKTNTDLVSDMEECYRLLKPNFKLAENPVQSLSHLLSLWDSTPSDKCARVMRLYDAFKSAKRRYDSDYALPTIGAVAMAGGAPHEVVNNILEVDTWLSGQEGFGFWSSITKTYRLIFASFLSECSYIKGDRMQLSVICSALTIIIAQQSAATY